MSWFAVKLEKARKQRQAVAKLTGLGAGVWYDYQTVEVSLVDLGCDDEISFRWWDPVYEWSPQSGTLSLPEPSNPSLLRKWLGRDFLHTVVGVNLPGAVLPDSTVRDADLVHLEPLDDMRFMCIGGQPITDDGLAHLVGLEKLEALLAGGTLITDAGLEHLKGLKNLTYLHLQGTQVTPEGVRKLQDALPECEIIYYE